MRQLDTLQFVYGTVVLTMAFHLFFGGIVVERMAGPVFGAHSALFVYRMSCLMALAAASVWVAIATRDFRAYWFTWFLALLVLLGIGVGSWRGFTSGEMGSHAVQAMTALLGFHFAHIFMRQRLDLWAVFKFTSYAMLIATPLLLMVFFLIVWLLAIPVPHYSLNFYGLIIPLAYFLAARNGLAVLFIFALIVLAGKRGLMLAGVAMMFWAYIAALFRDSFAGGAQKIRAWQWASIALVAVAPTAFAMVVPAEWDAPVIQASVREATSAIAVPEGMAVPAFGRYSDIADLNALSSFRGDLIVSVVEMLNRDPVQWWTGAGFGSSFIFAYRDEAAVTYGVDLMPLHLIMLYGIPATIIVFGYTALVMSWGWIATWKATERSEQQVRVALVAVLVGYFVCSMFTYVSIDPTLWFFLGAAGWLFGACGRRGDAV